MTVLVQTGARCAQEGMRTAAKDSQNRRASRKVSVTSVMCSTMYTSGCVANGHTSAQQQSRASRLVHQRLPLQASEDIEAADKGAHNAEGAVVVA